MGQHDVVQATCVLRIACGGITIHVMHVIRYQIYIKQGESQTMYITSICHQEWYQMCLLFGENFDEVVKISHTSASQQLSQLVVAVTWLYNVDEVFSLRPRDTSCIS